MVINNHHHSIEHDAHVSSSPAATAARAGVAIASPDPRRSPILGSRDSRAVPRSNQTFESGPNGSDAPIRDHQASPSSETLANAVSRSSTCCGVLGVSNASTRQNRARSAARCDAGAHRFPRDPSRASTPCGAPERSLPRETTDDCSRASSSRVSKRLAVFQGGIFPPRASRRASRERNFLNIDSFARSRSPSPSLAVSPRLPQELIERKRRALHVLHLPSLHRPRHPEELEFRRRRVNLAPSQHRLLEP